MSNLPQPVILEACDMRFASKNACFSNFEITIGEHPGAGSVVWMPLHIGRGRAMEFMLTGSDLDPKTAEKYGYINKAFDTPREMHDYVEKLAKRIALFPLDAISSVKKR
jgi:enoyl-CoA hydratase/carnithine racemase